MRVLIFSTAYFPFIGGAEVAVKELTNRLGDEIEFDLITARFNNALPRIERIGKVQVHRLGLGIPLVDKLLLPFLGARHVLRLNREGQYAYFWCIMASFGSGAAYIANWFQKKVPIVLTLQEGDSEEWLTRRWLGLIDLSWRMALARTQILTAISTYLIERAKRLGYKGRVELVPNGVDIKKFENVQHRVLKKDAVTLITTSRLAEKNGIKDLIMALKDLPPSVKLQIIGTGLLQQSLEELSSSFQLQDRITFFNAVKHADIPKYLHEADIFVRPSLSEGQGISFIEAMASGLPVVATPVGGIPDFLKDGETGIFCEPNNPKSIANAVERLINDAELRDRVRTNALKMVREKYDWDLIAGEMKSNVFNV